MKIRSMMAAVMVSAAALTLAGCVDEGYSGGYRSTYVYSSYGNPYYGDGYRNDYYRDARYRPRYRDYRRDDVRDYQPRREERRQDYRRNDDGGRRPDDGNQVILPGPGPDSPRGPVFSRGGS